jgi:hypothetical protein
MYWPAMLDDWRVNVVAKPLPWFAVILPWETRVNTMRGRNLLREAYDTLDAAIEASGSERYLLIDRVLQLWHAARDERPAPSPARRRSR